jgi:amino acid transporter
LLVAFALAIMADPISSVAYAIEAALGELNGDLGLILPTMGLVVLFVGIIVVNYRQLVSRFPQGGGAPAATGRAFGEPWAFLPIGALIVDFALTIAISDSSGASNIVAYLSELAPLQVVLALGLLLVVGAISWFGHSAQSLFSVMAIAFVAMSIVVFIDGVDAEPVASAVEGGESSPPALVAILLAFPVAMAPATGVEAPSTAIAQLGQLDNEGRKRFGRLALLATLFIVGTLTLGFTALAVRLGVGLPVGESTLTAEIAWASAGGFVFGAFQTEIILLLIATGASGLHRPVPGCSRRWHGRRRGTTTSPASCTGGSAGPTATTRPSGACSYIRHPHGNPHPGSGGGRANARALLCGLRFLELPGGARLHG